MNEQSQLQKAMDVSRQSINHQLIVLYNTLFIQLAMALIHVFFPVALLVLSFSLIIASATDYGYASKPEVDQTKPKEDVKYPDTYKTKPEEEKPKPEDVKYPQIYTPNPEEKLNVRYGYVQKPDEVKESQYPVGFEGLVLCKSGSSYVPIQGAVAKIICVAVDVQGYETRLPVSTCKTDAKGYFFSTLDHSVLEDGLKLRECQAFLESSPLENCKVPTDVNRGISGALLSSYHTLHDKKMKLYTISPFFYTTEPKSVPSGY